MQLYFQQSDLESWRQDIQKYQSNRKSSRKYTQSERKNSQPDLIMKKNFDPILQKYTDQNTDIDYKKKEEMKREIGVVKKKEIINRFKYNYDIVNTGDLKDKEQGLTYKPDIDQARHKRAKIKPIDHSQDGLILKIHKKQSETGDKFKQHNFNLISNKYCKDHEKKEQKESEECRKQLYDKKEKVLKYNAITASFYNENKETKYKENRKEDQKNHGSEYNKRFPPAWKYKEILIIDQTKPIPQELQIVDQRKEIGQRIYKLKYELEKEYREKDIIDSDMVKTKTLNRFNQNKYQEEFQKGYHLITNKELKATGTTPSLWDKLCEHKNGESRPKTQQSCQTYGNENNIRFTQQSSTNLGYNPKVSVKTEQDQPSQKTASLRSIHQTNQQSKLPSHQQSRINTGDSQKSNTFQIKTGGFINKK